MESVLLTNIKKLYDNELYRSVITAASLLTTLLKNDRSLTTPEMDYQLLLFYANSCYQERELRMAVRELTGVLLMRKFMVRYKNTQLIAIEGAYDHFSETETCYRLARCHFDLGETKQAINVLQGLPVSLRTPKVNLFLGKLIHSGNVDSVDAILNYKEVLRECPMAFEAIANLLELGVDGIEVNSLVVNASTVPKDVEWLGTWIKGHAQLYSRKHLEAAKTFKSINDNTKFHHNEHLITLIGKCFYYYGNSIQAQSYLEAAYMLNPYNYDAIMPLSVVFEYNNKLQELEKLATQLTNIHEFTSGHWFVLAQIFYANGKLEKAASFAHKAISVNSHNVEALLLRGKICLQIKRHKDAICFFRAAQCLVNYRFEVYKGLFHCYVGMKRSKEAQTMCAMAVRYFRESPRSLVMFARTLIHSNHPNVKKGAKKVLGKALEIDEHYAPAVALLAEIYNSEGETKEAIALLRKQLLNYPHFKLFTMLGDILSSLRDLPGALENYTIAINLEPKYQRALDGFQAMGNWIGKTNVPETSVTSLAPQDLEWPIECDDPSIEAVEFSSPAVAHDDNESDTFSDPFWQDVDAELTS